MPENYSNGWNEDKLGGVVDALDEIYNAAYEIKSCVRGCYTGAHTYEELQEYLIELGQRLINEAECMDISEDEYPDEEEDDDEY